MPTPIPSLMVAFNMRVPLLVNVSSVAVAVSFRTALVPKSDCILHSMVCFVALVGFTCTKVVSRTIISVTCAVVGIPSMAVTRTWVGVDVAVAEGEEDGEADGDAEGEAVGDAVGVAVAMGVSVAVGLMVAVAVGRKVAVGRRVAVAVGLAVRVGVGVGSGPVF